MFGLIALLWVTESWHGIKSHNAALIGLAILFMPGMFGFKWKDLQDRTIWGTFLFLACRLVDVGGNGQHRAGAVAVGHHSPAGGRPIQTEALHLIQDKADTQARRLVADPDEKFPLRGDEADAAQD